MLYRNGVVGWEAVALLPTFIDSIQALNNSKNSPTKDEFLLWYPGLGSNQRP